MGHRDECSALLNLLRQIFKTPSARASALRPDPIFIIGMHRSGTSALSGALEPLGLTVGKTVMPPHSEQGNPKGFYENLALTNLHDKFLKSIKSNWDDAAPVRAGQFTSAAAQRFQKQLIKLLVDEFETGRPLIKDPRMCRLMPLWAPLMQPYFPAAQVILPIRDPVEVACSLHKRDQMPLTQGLKLWVVHVLEGERNTRGYKRIFTTYDQLTQSPLATVAELANKLGLPAEAVGETVKRRIDAGLRHHQGRGWPVGELHEDLVRSIHQTLAANEPGKETKLDALRAEYYGHMGWECGE